MPEQYRYLKVGISKINAIISINTRNENVKTLFCSNMEFCDGFNFKDSICPEYCQLIVEAKKYVFGNRELNADVVEIVEEASKKSLVNLTNLVCYN